jgi:hypothetical protein
VSPVTISETKLTLERSGENVVWLQRNNSIITGKNHCFQCNSGIIYFAVICVPTQVANASNCFAGQNMCAVLTFLHQLFSDNKNQK